MCRPRGGAGTCWSRPLTHQDEGVDELPPACSWLRCQLGLPAIERRARGWRLGTLHLHCAGSGGTHPNSMPVEMSELVGPKQPTPLLPMPM